MFEIIAGTYPSGAPYKQVPGLAHKH